MPNFPPFVLRWDESANPLPRRAIRPAARLRARLPQLDPPAWVPTGALDQPFDFCGYVQRLCADIVAGRPEFLHIDPSCLLFGVTQARSGRVHGLQARVTPLRFRGGAMLRRRQGCVYQVQRYLHAGREMLYLVTFCLPRFLDQDFDDKFITLFHELYHIGPLCDGDLRRHDGRYKIHSHSKKHYDAHMADLARMYLADGPDPRLHDFLRLDFGQLIRRHGSVVGVMLPRPKLIPLPVGQVFKPV